MFRWLKKSFEKPRSLIGLDIGAAAVKLVQLELHNDGYRLMHAAIAKRSGKNDVVNTLHELIEPLTVFCKDAVIALPDNQVISKIIQVDASFTASEIEAQVMFALEEHIPHAFADIYFDFEVQNHSLNNPEMLDVLLVATRKNTCDVLIETINATGLMVQVIDVESYAIERVVSRLQALKSAQITAVLDVGVSKITLHVLKNSRNIFIRSEPVESSQVNHAEQLVATLRRMLQFFFSAYPYDQISQIYLSGGAALFYDVGQYLHHEMQLEILPVNPFVDMSLTQNVDGEALQQIAPCLLLSCGLALHGFLL